MCFLGREERSRRGTGKEGEDAEGPGSDNGNKRLDNRQDRSDKLRYRRLNDLHGDMGGRAKRTVRVQDISVRMDVNRLNRTTNNDQHDAKQAKEKSPRTLHL